MSERTDELMDQLASKRGELAALDKQPGMTGFLPKDDESKVETRELREALVVEIANLEQQLEDATRAPHS